MPLLLSPRYWGAHLLALVAVAAAAGLGGWQYDAWQERRAAEAEDLTRQPVPLDEAIGPDDPFPGDRVGQPVDRRGHLAAGRNGAGVRSRARRPGRLLGGDAGRDRRRPAGRRCRSCAAGRRARTTYPRPRPGPPSWSAGCSRRRAPARRTPTRPTTCSRSCGSPTWSSASTRTCTAPTRSSRTGTAATTGPTDSSRRPRAAPRRRPLHRRPQPALRDRVVVLRGVRALHLGALDAGDEVAAERPLDRRGLPERPVGWRA